MVQDPDTNAHSCDCPSGTNGSRCEILELVGGQDWVPNLGDGGTIIGIVIVSLAVVLINVWYARKRRVQHDMMSPFDAVDERLERQNLEDIEIS